MSKPSLVLEPPPADNRTACDYFARKLALETDPSDVYADLQSGLTQIVLIDVRSPTHYAHRHAQGASNIPYRDMSAERMAAFPDDAVFVVYCWGPGCNAADNAALRLSMLGRPVKMMIGGIEYWADRENLPVVCGQAQ
jgi:rhodanese-related sulfurtransferase